MPTDTDIKDCFAWTRERTVVGRLRVSKGEFDYMGNGVAFVVDPKTKGCEELFSRDAHSDETLGAFMQLPSSRDASHTAAVLGGAPRGSIAGIIVTERNLEADHITFLKEQFPTVPMFDDQGELF